ncbi:tail fiber domain-containing protein [Psychroserpens sp. AS72]|uniref:tail fiber domain-containing protein n=1 Tax=Psychroserpens sp. AS72 TaxID=3135775 RepID=UPI00317E94B9
MINKTLQILIILILIPIIGFSQNGINYKALIKDDNGNAISNQTVDIKFKLQSDNGSTLTELYQESHSITTSQNGIAILNIGNGTYISGAFSNIDWNQTILLNTELDIEQDGTYINLGSEPFNFVPRAYYAEKAQTAQTAITAQTASNVSGLEAVNEGWRLIGSNTDVGSYAVDLSQSFSNEFGATGYESFAVGRDAHAIGFKSVAIGDASKATGNGSFAIGSMAEANVNYSYSIGVETITNSLYSLSIGRGNLGLTTSAFEIGNGLGIPGNVVRNNIFTIFKNGNVETNGTIKLLEDSTSDVAIRTKGAEALWFNGSYFSWGFGGTSNYFAKDIGIGITSPSAKLHISGNNDTGLGNNNGLLVLGDTNGNNISIDNNEIMAKNNGNAADLNLQIEGGNVKIGGTVYIGDETIVDGGNNTLRINASLIPDVDNSSIIGNPSLRWKTIYATNGTINTSDRREKKNIKNLDYGLKEILRMQPVSFNWKNDNNPDIKLGLIAQDLLELIPEVVKTHTWEKDEGSDKLTKKELDRLGVYYSDLIPVLINAIKEQNVEIDNLKKALEAQKSLEERIANIEQKISN